MPSGIRVEVVHNPQYWKAACSILEGCMLKNFKKLICKVNYLAKQLASN
jgi:hypothetical protein